MSNKRTLRADLRARRTGFVASGPPPIAPPPSFLQRLLPGKVVATFHPVGSEADPAQLAMAAMAAGCLLALPHVVDRATPLRFLGWDGQAALAAGPFGLRQPGEDAAEVAPDNILAPLVAFDRRLERLGQGAGHYDRAFAAFPDAWRVGVAWSVQEVTSLPADPWDVPLHAIVTEQEWITR